MKARMKVNYNVIASVGSTSAPNSLLFLDQSIYSIFSRIRVIHGSNVIEVCLYTNRLWTFIYDLQVSEV